MAIYANRVRVKSHILELIKMLLMLIKRFTLLILVALCLFLMLNGGDLISRSFLEVTGKITNLTSNSTRFIIDFTHSIYSNFDNYRNAAKQNAFLKDKLAKLDNIEEKYIALLAENKQLKELLNYAGQSNKNFKTTKLLSVSTSPFSSIAIINAGDNEQVKVDDIVSSKDGLIGRVIKTSSNFSKVMLIDDYNSRVPVITAKTRLRAILAKQDNLIKLIYIDKNRRPEIGEVIYTSGDGIVYPDGIKVGEVSAITSNGVIVEPAVRVKDEYYINLQSVHK